MKDLERENCHKRNCNNENSHKRIKTSVVIAKKVVQKVGDLVIDAPIGVGIDKATGNLTKPVHLELFGDIVMKPKIIKGKLINEGFVPTRLIVEDNDPEPCPDVRKGIIKQVFIPVQSVIEIKGIKPCDDVDEKIKIESFSVFGLPDTSQGLAKIKLILKVVLKVKVLISRECVIPVLIAEFDSD